MRIGVLSAALLAAVSLSASSQAQRPKLEGDKFKIAVGGSTLGSDNGFRNAILSGSSLENTFRFSYNTMGKEKAHELRVGYDRYSGGSSDTLGVLDVQYIWKFGSRQEAYYGIGIGQSVGARGGNFSAGTATLGLNIGKKFFIEARNVNDGTDYVTTGFVGLRF